MTHSEPTPDTPAPAQAVAGPSAELWARLAAACASRTAWAGAALFVMVLVAYIPALSGDIHCFDDDEYIVINPLMRSVGGLFTMWLVPTATPQYYPMTFTTFWVEYQLWGIHAFGYHLNNILLHAACAILLWRLLVRLEVPGAWLAGALFAVHPVCVESVAWVAERKNVLSMALALGSMLFYLRFAPPGGASAGPAGGDFGSAPSVDAIRRSREAAQRNYVWAFALFVAAMLSKTAVIALPAVLLVIVWWKRGRITWRDLRPLVPFFVVGFALGLTTAVIEKYVLKAEGHDWSHSYVERTLIAGRALWFYAVKVVWPYPLAHFYPKWEISDREAWQYLFPLSALAVMAGLWLARGRIGRGPLAAVLIFAGVLVPGLGFFNIWFMKYSYVADHFQYHACAALIALLAAGAALAVRRLPAAARALPWAAAGAVLVLFTVLSFDHSRAYHDLGTLAEDTLKTNTDSWISYTNLGHARNAAGQTEEAVRLTREALKRYDLDPRTHNNLSSFLFKMGQEQGFRPGQLDEIIAHFETALKIDPSLKDARDNLAAALLESGRLQDAIDCYSKIVKLNPDDPTALSGLVRARLVLAQRLLAEDQVRAAIAELEQVLYFAPDTFDAQLAMAQACQRDGEQRRAAEHFSEAIRLDPKNVDALNSLAALFVELGDADRAVDHARRALELKPDSAAAQATMQRAIELKMKRKPH